MSAPLDRERLARVLGTLGNGHDGKTLSAARQAELLRQEAGSTLAHLGRSAAPVTLALPEKPPRYPKTVHEAIALVAYHPYLLSLRDQKFLQNVAGWIGPLTPTQHALSKRLVVRARLIDSGFRAMASASARWRPPDKAEPGQRPEGRGPNPDAGHQHSDSKLTEIGPGAYAGGAA